MTDKPGNIFPAVLRIAMGVYATAQILLVLALFANHLRFPLFLDLMEGTIFQHVQRAASLQSIYPDPTPDFVPLAYNPLYYVLCAPICRLLGLNLLTLRVVSFFASVLCGLVVFWVVGRKTGSNLWGLIALGLFANAYRVMGCYLDTAHSDSWMLATALLGTWILDRYRSRIGSLIGVMVLVASFWFKQHGAIFALGGLAWLTYRDGFVKTLPCWLLALLAGPIIYLFGGTALFGPQFHYFTWQVPRGWTTMNLRTFFVFFGFIGISYPLLSFSAGWISSIALFKSPRSPDVWHFQFIAACLTGFMGALDPGSAFNVFIPMGVFIIILGVIGFSQLGDPHDTGSALALVCTFALLIYNPWPVFVSPYAKSSYQDLVRFIGQLDGPVYAPWLGQLPGEHILRPAAHWVALEDMVRGPHRDTQNQPIVTQLLAPALPPHGPAYILANKPLDKSLGHFLGLLIDRYALVLDFEDRFKPLRVLPGRYDHGWPRYLYHYISTAPTTTSFPTTTPNPTTTSAPTVTSNPTTTSPPTAASTAPHP